MTVRGTHVSKHAKRERNEMIVTMRDNGVSWARIAYANLISPQRCKQIYDKAKGK